MLLSRRVGPRRWTARPLACWAGLLLATASTVGAQEADTLTAEDGWRRSLTAALAASQASYSNWQEGGIDALAATLSAEAAMDRVAGRVFVQHDARLAVGVLRQDTLAVRKSEDVVRYGFSAELRNAARFHPTVALTARSQFAPGYDYSPDPGEYPTLPLVQGAALKVSDAVAPAVFTQSAGVTYRPVGWASARVSFGLKETVVAIRRLRPVYGNGLDEPVRVQAGLEGEARAEREVATNVRLRARLSAFQAFNQIGNEAPDLRLDAALVMKVNGILSVSLDTATLYDADVSGALQFKEALAVGLSFAVL